MMADAKHLLEFLEGGVGMFFNVRPKFLRIEFAPMPPALFWGQRAFLGGDQIPIDGTPGQIKPPGGLGFGTTVPNEFHHPFPQVQRTGFHARKPITLCPNVNMKCYMKPTSKPARSSEFFRPRRGASFQWRLDSARSRSVWPKEKFAIPFFSNAESHIYSSAWQSCFSDSIPARKA